MVWNYRIEIICFYVIVLVILNRFVLKLVIYNVSSIK